MDSTTTMQPHPLQLPHYMLTFQGHEASQIYLFNSAVLVVALWLSRVLDLSCSKRWPTGCVASNRTRPLTPLVGKFSKSKVGPKKKFALGGGKYALVAMREAADDVLGKALVGMRCQHRDCASSGAFKKAVWPNWWSRFFNITSSRSGV